MTDLTYLPLITVVTPSYNHGRFIEDTILSVLNQEYPNIEYLVVDGGSTDNTLDILGKYGDRLTWISEPDSGQSHAINKGFRMARGEILCWLNADDLYEPGAIGTAISYFRDNPDVAMIYGLVNVISESGALTQAKTRTRPFDLWSVVHWAYGIDQASTFFKRKALEDVGFLDEDLHWCMDWDLWVRLGSKYQAANLDVTFASIRMHSSAKTSTGGLKRLREILSVMRRYSDCSVTFGVVRAGFGAIHTMLKYRFPSLYPYLSGTISYIKNNSLNRFYENFRGVYDDNWLGKKARFMFPAQAESNAIRFILELPDERRLLSNCLKAKAAGRIVAAQTMSAPGRYELVVPYDRNALRPTEIELVFSKVLPCDSQNRKLACKLIDVNFVPATYETD